MKPMAMFLASAFVLGQPGTPPAQPQAAPPQMASLEELRKEPWRTLPAKDQESLGLDKLSEQERAAWAAFYWRGISKVSESAALGDSAMSYLLNEGWDEVKVLGSRTVKDEWGLEKQYTVVEKGFTKYLCDGAYSYLKPGRYLAETSYSRVRLIDRSGIERRLYVEKVE